MVEIHRLAHRPLAVEQHFAIAPALAFFPDKISHGNMHVIEENLVGVMLLV